MRILFDQGTPAPLRHHLSARDISTAFEQRWGQLKNGDLLEQAEASGFEVLITTDQNLRYQQNLSTRKIAVIVTGTTSWPRIPKAVSRVTAAIASGIPGSYIEVVIP